MSPVFTGSTTRARPSLLAPLAPAAGRCGRPATARGLHPDRLLDRDRLVDRRRLIDHRPAPPGSSRAAPGRGGGPSGTFTPQGCQFSIATRPEYVGFQTAPSTVGATPNIRRVRLRPRRHRRRRRRGPRRPTSTTIASMACADRDEGTRSPPRSSGARPWTRPSGLRRTGAGGVTLGHARGRHQHKPHGRRADARGVRLRPRAVDRTYYRVEAVARPARRCGEQTSTRSRPPQGGPDLGEDRHPRRRAQRGAEQRLADPPAAADDDRRGAPDLLEATASTPRPIRASGSSEARQRLEGRGTVSASALPQILTLFAHGNHENHTTLFYGNVVQLPGRGELPPARRALLIGSTSARSTSWSSTTAFIVDPTGDPRSRARSSRSGLTKRSPRRRTRTAEHRCPGPSPRTTTRRTSATVGARDGHRRRFLGRQFFAPLRCEVPRRRGLPADTTTTSNAPEADPPRRRLRTTPSSRRPRWAPSTWSCGGSRRARGPGGHERVDRGEQQDPAAGGGIGFYTLLTADAHDLTLDTHVLEADASDPLVESPAFTITEVASRPGRGARCGPLPRRPL